MNYIELFKKYSWLINIAMLILLAYLLAGFTSTYISSRLFTIPVINAGNQSVESKTIEPEIKKDQNYYSSIVGRNIFNSSVQSAEGGVNGSKGPVTKSDINAKLLGTIAGSTEYAYAVIRTNNDINIYRVKDNIGNATILSIERKKVIILRNGAKEELSMYEEKHPQLKSTLLSKSYSVKRVGQGNYVIPENQFKAATQNMGALLTQARVVPNIVGGRIKGYRIFAISPGSIYSSIGLRDGDVLRSVNGIQVTTPESALQLFQQLRNERRFTLNVERNGQPMTLNYTVQ